MADIFPDVTTLDQIRIARDQDLQVPEPNRGLYDWNILAEGDSWFSIGAFPSSNLLLELPLPKSSIVLNLAYPGDTIEHMSSIAGNPDLRKMLHDTQWGYKWDLIVLSAGGNDVIGRAREFILTTSQGPDTPDSWIDQAKLKAMVEGVKQRYRDIVAIRDEPGSINANVPIVIHTYDYPMPRNAPAKFLIAGFTGPWLFKALKTVPAKHHFEIARRVIDALAGGLTDLTTGPGALPKFYVVNTRGTLVPSAPGSMGNNNDWMNEIHPNPQGYRKIARKIAPKIAAVLT